MVARRGGAPAKPWGGAPELELTLQALRDDAAVAHGLLGFSAALAEVRSHESTLDIAVRLVPDLFGADRSFAADWDRARDRLILHAHLGFTAAEEAVLYELASHPESYPLLRSVLQQRKPVLVEDAAADPRINPEEAAARGLGAWIGIPLIERGAVRGGLAVEYRHPRRFSAKEESLAHGITRQLGVALANARRFNLLQDLRNFGLIIGSSVRLSSVARVIAEGAAMLLSGEGACLYLMESARNTLVPAATYGEMLSESDDLARIDLGESRWRSLAEGKTLLLSPTGDPLEPEAEEPMGIAATPVLGPGSQMIGAILVFLERSVSLCRDETEALKVLAAQSASAIENAQRFERQRTVARRLQEGLLATEMPAIEGCSVAAVYEPATGEADIGGDFYDVFELDAGVYGIVVGDVSGKGAEAAAQTAQAKYVLRAFAMRNPTPASVLFHLNNALVQTLGEDRFATVVYGVLEAGPRRLQVAVAGHPSPLVYRHESGEVEEVTPAGMVVGAFPDVQFDQETIELHNGDVWLAYTDGLVEARLDKELFGYDRLKDALVRLAPGLGMNELTRRLYDEAGDFGKVGDDTVILGLACDPRLP